jgi:predicted acetyltransferase
VNVEAVRVGDEARPVVEQLIQLCLHDMTDFNPFPIGEDGRYEYDHLDRFWRYPYLIRADGELAGFALVIDECPVTSTRPCRFMAEFFVLRPYRRRGVAREAAGAIVARHPGPWHVGVIERNETAAAFWRSFLEPRDVSRRHVEHDGDRWLISEFKS